MQIAARTCLRFELGIAVANAVSSVKEIADVIVDSNNDDRVAKYIEKKIFRIEKPDK